MSLLERLLPSVGDLLVGRYQLVDEISRGSFGVVLAARQQPLDARVTIKILMPHILSNEDMVRRFEREVELVKGLRHPNTIRILDVGRTDEGLPFYVMEHVPGRSLHQVLLHEGSLSPARTRDIAVQIVRSLSEAHQRGIVHRDLKPSNLLVCDIGGARDFIKVLDFGVAKVVGTKPEQLTASGVVIGTPAYMSPEQARGRADLDGRSDLFTVGLIMTECLTGRRMLNVSTLFEAISLHALPEPLGIDRRLLSTPLFPVIAKATHVLRGHRYGSAEDMLEALVACGPLSETVIPGAAPSARRPRQDTPVTMPATPSPMLVFGADSALPDWMNIPSSESAGLRGAGSGLGSSLSVASLLALMAVIVLVVGPTANGAGHQTWNADARPAPAALEAQAPDEPRADDARADDARLPVRGLAEPIAAAIAKRAAASNRIISRGLLSQAVAAAGEGLLAALPDNRVVHFEGTRGASIRVASGELGLIPFDLSHPRLRVHVAVEVRRRGYRAERRSVDLTQDRMVFDLVPLQPGRSQPIPTPSAPDSHTAAHPFGQMPVFGEGDP